MGKLWTVVLFQGWWMSGGQQQHIRGLLYYCVPCDYDADYGHMGRML